MTLKMRLIWIFLLVNVRALGTQASTHWMVTESGLIQPKVRIKPDYNSFLRNVCLCTKHKFELQRNL